MISRVFSGTGIALLLAASACAPAAAPSPTAAAPSPTAAAPKPPEAKPAASPAAKPAASPAAKPAASPAAKAAAAKFDSAQWDQVVAAAKREGRVAIAGGASTDLRDGLTEGFQKKYPEIQVDYTGGQGGTQVPKILTEQAAGANTTDLLIQGTTTVIEAVIPANAAERTRDWIGPEALNESKWLGGKFTFADDAEIYNLVGIAYVKPPFVVNTQMVSVDEFKSYRDLLDPKWKGKIAMLEPTQAGGGLANVTFWYTTPALGKEFVQQLFRQDITISRDNRQLLDWVAKGQYPLVIGVGEVETTEAMRRGLPIRHAPGESFREGAYITPGNASTAILKNPPHPNALKVYFDWLLSVDGQHGWSKGAGFASLRQDVPRDHVDDYLIPKSGVQYQENYREKYVKLRQEVVEFVKTVRPS